MPFTLQEFAKKRPYLFHLTDRSHREPLRQQLRLYPASDLFEKAGQTEWTRQRRRDHVEIVVDRRKLKIRDQAPLHEGNMELGGGWTFARFLAHLNRRVFFWPGRKDGLPIPHGIRHFERYSEEAPCILRLRSERLFTLNHSLNPEFCRYNSGSPRWTYGKPSPRGPETFVTCAKTPFNAVDVVEVTFTSPVRLPEEIEVGNSPSGPWSSL
jgi:hypothetical protein